MPQSKLRFSFVRVSEIDQAWQLMGVRNECREGMTHNTTIIDAKQQQRFYNEHLSPFRGDGIYEAYLLLDEMHPIGYGLLKWDKEKEAYWMTAGLIKEYRGRGLSRFLISYITEMGHREGHDVYIDVWEDNLALIGDIKVGYEVVDQKIVDGRVLNIMKHNRERLLRLSEQMLLKNFGKTHKLEVPREEAQSLKDTLQEMIEVNQIAIESYD
jgi:GNAT superfamily N-acetyltransferase